MNLELFSFLNREHRLKHHWLILVRLSLINMHSLVLLLWLHNRCCLLKTEPLIFLSEAGDSLLQTLKNLADRSNCKSLKTSITSWSLFSLPSRDMKLKALMAVILLEVVNILLHLARLSFSLVDMIFEDLVLSTQSVYFLICRVEMFLNLLIPVR